MRPATVLSALGPLVLILCVAAPVRASKLRLVSSDARGVTLRLDLDHYDLTAPDAQGRSTLTVSDLDLLDSPGRPQLPFAKTLIALPRGAGAVVSLIEGGATESREVRITIGEKAGFRDDRGGLGIYPVAEKVAPISDGIWPSAEAEVGDPFDLRRQRVAVVQVHPFRYDETTGRLEVRRSLTVHVSFVGGAALPGLGAAGEDRYFEPVLSGAVLNYEQGRAWRAEPSLAREPLEPAIGRAAGPGAAQAFGFDESQVEVRVKLDSTGVWALDFDELRRNGFPLGVPISEVSVHRHEFIENAAVPYVTIEMPIELDDAGTPGVFDSGDRIVLYTRDWAKRSGASIPQRHWGDAEVVYVTHLPGGKGLRMAGRNGWHAFTSPAMPLSYPYAQRFEKNFAEFISFPHDTLTDPFDWTQLMLYFDRPDTIKFETSDLDTTHAVLMSVTLQGRSDQLHYDWCSIKNGLGKITTVYDSSQTAWSGLDANTFTGTLTGSALSEGLTNSLAFWGKSFPDPPDPATNNRTDTGLNYFDVTYWRRFVPFAGYLPCNSADAVDGHEIFATPFGDSASLRAYDVTNPLDPRRLTNVRIERSGFTVGLRLQDSTGLGVPRQYVVFDTPKAPASDHYAPVTRYTLENNSVGDYLLVVPEAFLSAVQPLQDLRRSQGMSVVVAPLEGINDEFNGGRHADFSIKRFIRYAYNRWNARFVLLVGGAASEDPQNFLGNSCIDWIPTHLIQGPVGIFIGAGLREEFVPSDSWYVWCLNCPDPSLAPKLHDLFLGRLPVQSAGQAASVIHKIVRYETVAPDETWRRRLLLFSDDDYSGETTFGGGGGSTTTYCQKDYETRFRLLNEKIRSVILDEAGLKQSDPELFNLGDYLPAGTVITPCTPPCDPDTCRADRSATITFTRATVTPKLFTRLNAGRLWWNYQGHANEQVLSHESFYLNGVSSDDKDLYANDGRPFLFSAFSCHTNNFGRRWECTPGGFNPGPSLGADMVTAPSDRGAIASWASVGYESVPTNGVSHINVELARALFSSPPRDPYLSSGGSRVVLGQSIALALARWVPLVRTDPFQRDVGITYTLLGDPATRLSIGAPQMLVTANGDTITDGLPVRLHTPLDTLRLEADLVSNQELRTLTFERSVNGGPATPVLPSDYTVTPAFPDTGSTGSGGRRFHLLYQTHLTSSSYRYSFRTTDRDGVPGHLDALFEFQTFLRADGSPLNTCDPVAPTANLSMLVFSPGPIDPNTDPSALTLTINGVPQPFVATAVASDTSGREWVLSWTHPPFALGTYDVKLVSSGGASEHQTFTVNLGGPDLKIQNLLAFPNPFDDDLGTRFSFDLNSGSPTDVHVRVYTVSGRLVYTRTERGLRSGCGIQIAWDGRDSEGDLLANGIYLYRLLAHNASNSFTAEGRLVKLRKPHRVDPATP